MADHSLTIPTVHMLDWYADTIRYTHTRSTYQEENTYKATGSGDMVRLHFGIRGNYNVSYPTINKSFELIGGHHNVLYADPFDMEYLNKTQEIETFGIQFPKQLFIGYTENGNDLLKRFCNDISEGRGAILSPSWGAISLPIQQVINEILNCQYTGGLKSLFFLSKSIELLVRCADSYAHAGNEQTPSIKTSYEKEKIIAARDVINARIQSPPGLSEVARMVQLNEYKLKQGFRELFQTTVFNYLTGQRLALAKQLLLDSDKTVAEIAYELGYATPQHFNNAFRKKFGSPPNLVRKNSKSAIR